MQNQKIWEDRYSGGLVLNKYPFDSVVSFVMRNYAKTDRKNISILDYGSGGGNHTIFLAEEGFDYYAIDYSPSAIKHTKEKLIGIGYKPRDNQLVCSDFQNMPFNDNSFEAIIDRQSLDQNRYDTIKLMVKEIYRTLKPGGLYFGVNFSEGDPNKHFGVSLGQNDYYEFTQGTFKGLGQRHFFTHTEIKELFIQFEIIDLKIRKVYSLLNENIGSEEIILTAKKI